MYKSHCPTCHRALNIPESDAGKTLRCDCGATFLFNPLRQINPSAGIPPADTLKPLTQQQIVARNYSIMAFFVLGAGGGGFLGLILPKYYPSMVPADANLENFQILCAIIGGTLGAAAFVTPVIVYGRRYPWIISVGLGLVVVIILATLILKLAAIH